MVNTPKAVCLLMAIGVTLSLFAFPETLRPLSGLDAGNAGVQRERKPSMLETRAPICYRITDLGSLGGESFAHGINGSGEIVASANKPGYLSTAVIWHNGADYEHSRAFLLTPISLQSAGKQPHPVLPTEDRIREHVLPDLSNKDLVREGVFRYQFSHFGEANKAGKKRFFIGLGYKPKDDPSPGLIQKLQSKTYSVKGISQCKRSIGGVTDVKTGEAGLAFFVTDVSFTSPTKAQAHASFFRNGKGGNNATYNVENVKDSWKVTKCTITDVS